MPDEIVIRAEGLGKKYIIGHQAEREDYVALRDVIVRGAKTVVRKAVDTMRGRRAAAKGSREEFWALRDVNFEVKCGEVIGIIGRNGAGKSTLLKILSRITEPTEGRVTIKGRVASLLEVGTGFHPELTGRENIFLNGAILGMKHAEIRRKFDEIVDFSGVEKFLDTPVKRYSSGMYVRLAFAVAAHLEPEILIVDEVLAVGDAEFQKKCLGKMGEVAGGGRTVLFVSHNMTAVELLCTNAILMTGGRVATIGPVDKVVEQYLSTAVQISHRLDLSTNSTRMGSGQLQICEVTVWGDNESAPPKTGGAMNVLLRFGGNIVEAQPSRVSIAIGTALGTPLIICSTEMTSSITPMIAAGDQHLFHIPMLPLTEGTYVLTLFIEQRGVVQDWIPDACKFNVLRADYGRARNIPKGYDGKIVLVEHSWSSVASLESPKQRPLSLSSEIGELR